MRMPVVCRIMSRGSSDRYSNGTRRTKYHVALRRFAQPMKAEEAEQYLKTVFIPLLRIHSSQVLYLDALDLANHHRLPWYDSLIVASALQAQCGLLLSEDFQHSRKLGALQIVNPFL